jgi:hypothetical protein
LIANLSKELRVGENFELDGGLALVGFEQLANSLSGSNRNSGLLHNDNIVFGILSNGERC